MKGLQPFKQLLRGNRGKGITAYYRQYIERWEAGESYDDLLAEWQEREDTPGIGRMEYDGFYQAFYRRGFRKRSNSV